MPEPYNLTNISATRDFLELTQAVGTLSGDLLGLGILILIFAVTFISASGTGAKSALGYSLFMCLILGFFLQLLNLISGSIYIIIAILLGLYVVWLYLSGETF